MGASCPTRCPLLLYAAACGGGGGGEQGPAGAGWQAGSDRLSLPHSSQTVGMLTAMVRQQHSPRAIRRSRHSMATWACCPAAAASPAGLPRWRPAPPAHPLPPRARSCCSGPCESPAAGPGLQAGRWQSGAGRQAVRVRVGAGVSTAGSAGSGGVLPTCCRHCSCQLDCISPRCSPHTLHSAHCSQAPLTCIHDAVPCGIQHAFELQVVAANPDSPGAHHRVQRPPVGGNLQQHALQAGSGGEAEQGAAGKVNGSFRGQPEPACLPACIHVGLGLQPAAPGINSC